MALNQAKRMDINSDNKYNYDKYLTPKFFGEDGLMSNVSYKYVQYHPSDLLRHSETITLLDHFKQLQTCKAWSSKKFKCGIKVCQAKGFIESANKFSKLVEGERFMVALLLQIQPMEIKDTETAKNITVEEIRIYLTNFGKYFKFKHQWKTRVIKDNNTTKNTMSDHKCEMIEYEEFKFWMPPEYIKILRTASPYKINGKVIDSMKKKEFIDDFMEEFSDLEWDKENIELQETNKRMIDECNRILESLKNEMGKRTIMSRELKRVSELNKKLTDTHARLNDEHQKLRNDSSKMAIDNKKLVDDLLEDYKKAMNSNKELEKTNKNLGIYNEKLSGELEEKNSEKDCAICWEKLDNKLVTLDPCGHTRFHRICLTNLQFCPLCRTKIQKSIDSYI